jgi:hypothetical protein
MYEFCPSWLTERKFSFSNTKVDYDDGLVKEFEMEIERIKVETAKSDERRLQMEKALQESEDEIICLKAKVELAVGRAESMERENTRIAMQLEEQSISNEKYRDDLMKEMCDLKTQHRELVSSLMKSESEKRTLMNRQEDEHESFLRELRQLEAEQMLMAEKKNDALQEELKSVRDEVQALRLGNAECVIRLSDRVAELERTNEDLRGQLVSAEKRNYAAQENDVASLKSTIEALTEDKLDLERRLNDEIQKSMERRNEAKERRRKFKGKLEILKDGKTLFRDCVHI